VLAKINKPQNPVLVELTSLVGERNNELDLKKKKSKIQTGVVVQDSNPCTRESETERWRVPGQSGVHS
jgi:hypothetical protein